MVCRTLLELAGCFSHGKIEVLDCQGEDPRVECHFHHFIASVHTVRLAAHCLC